MTKSNPYCAALGIPVPRVETACSSPDANYYGLLTHRLAPYEMVGAIGVRPLLRTLNIDPGDRRLAELGPSQKTRQLSRRGRTLTITTTLLVQGSCGISRPFGDDRTVRGYLQRGEHTKLRRRLEADAKSLFALYQYGRLHGAVRLRWGFLDEMLPAPWIHRDEPTLHQLLKEAHTRGVALDVVVGSVPGWRDPWSRAITDRGGPSSCRR